MVAVCPSTPSSCPSPRTIGRPSRSAPRFLCRDPRPRTWSCQSARTLFSSCYLKIFSWTALTPTYLALQSHLGQHQVALALLHPLGNHLLRSLVQLFAGNGPLFPGARGVPVRRTIARESYYHQKYLGSVLAGRSIFLGRCYSGNSLDLFLSSTQ